MSGLDPIGEIFNYDDNKEFQDRGVQHDHGMVHVQDAPRLDESSDAEIVQFVDRYIPCSLPDKESRVELHNLVTSVQKHCHTKTWS